MGTGRTYQVTELGKFRPKMTPVDELGTGEVGYVIANIRDLADVRIGDTITDDAHPAAGRRSRLQAAHADGLLRLLSRATTTDYPKLRAAFEKLAAQRRQLLLRPAELARPWASASAAGSSACCTWRSSRSGSNAKTTSTSSRPPRPSATRSCSRDGTVKRIDSPSELPDRTHDRGNPRAVRHAWRSSPPTDTHRRRS